MDHQHGLVLQILGRIQAGIDLQHNVQVPVVHAKVQPRRARDVQIRVILLGAQHAPEIHVQALSLALQLAQPLCHGERRPGVARRVLVAVRSAKVHACSHDALRVVPGKLVDQFPPVTVRVDQAVLLQGAESSNHRGHARAGSSLHVCHAQPATRGEPARQYRHLHVLLGDPICGACRLALRPFDHLRQQRFLARWQLALKAPFLDAHQEHPAREPWAQRFAQPVKLKFDPLVRQAGFLQQANAGGAHRFVDQPIGQGQQHTTQLDGCAGAASLQQNIAAGTR